MFRKPYLMIKQLALVAGFVLAASANAQQWDGSNTGKITTIDVTNAENFGFRVYLDGRPLCTNGPAWAYLNGSDSNYKTYVSLLMMARAMDRPVLIYTSKDQYGYCKIGYVSMQG